ncbi:MAG: hypothetical protein OK455_01560, partial [Thaumarchaeota archaeon]|nr:hypothetical protein [Nitrososphaerota archaeon]
MPTTELHRAPATVTNLFRDVQANLTVGIESNGKGVMGLIVDLPGGFVRGRNEAEAIQKVNTEAGRYLSWIGRPRDERE